MNKEQMLLDALNKFGNFTTVTQEFSEEQLEVIYELMDMVERADHIEFAIYLTGHDRETIEQMYRDWKR
ncbi:MAG: hypothetical protein ABIJ40_03495 [Bacteroidota bacterium]